MSGQTMWLMIWLTIFVCTSLTAVPLALVLRDRRRRVESSDEDRPVETS